MGGHRCWTPATDAVAWLLAGSTTATTPDLARPAGRCSGQTPSGRAPTRTAQQQGLRGPPRCHGRVWPPPRRQLQVVRRRPAGASAHCSPRTNFGSSVERTAKLHPLCKRVRTSAVGSSDSVLKAVHGGARVLEDERRKNVCFDISVAALAVSLRASRCSNDASQPWLDLQESPLGEPVARRRGCRG
jgi:hypothetical protein